MAAVSPILLTPSPVSPVRDRTLPATSCNMSSSPTLPSISKFFAEVSKRSKTSTRGSPVPRKAATAFARASSQSRQSQAVILSHNAAPLDEVGFQSVGRRVGEQRLSKSNKQCRKAATAGDKTTASSEALKTAETSHPEPQKVPVESYTRARKPIADNGSLTASEAVEVCTTEKNSSKTFKAPAQTTIQKGKVKKAPGSYPSTNESKGPLNALTLEKPSDQEVSEALATQDANITLGLEEAVRRRRDWTPIEDTADCSVAPYSVEEAPKGESKLQDSTIGESRFKHMKSFLGDYQYAHKISEVMTKPEITRRSTGEASTKRRKVEVGWYGPDNRLRLIENQLIPVSFAPLPEVTKLKSKCPKKRPQTVTGKATAPFISVDELEPNGILEYVAPKSNSEILNEVNNVETGHLSKGKVRQKKTSKGKTTREKPSKTAPVLLPPEAALRRADKQDLLFGTSSQLASDESPTYTRELQQAIAESESFDSTTLPAHDGAITLGTVLGSTIGFNTSLHTASRNLWSAAARNQNGALQDAEFVDLSITPKPRVSRHGDVSQVRPAQTDNSIESCLIVNQQPREVDSGWTTIDDSSKGPGTADTNSISTSSQAHQNVQIPIPMSLAEASLRNRPRSRSPIKNSGGNAQKEQCVQEKPQGMPNYRAFTTAELTQGIAAYGFKPVKRRDQQIALLEKCWKSKNSAALQPLPTILNPSQVPATVEVDSELPKQKSPPKPESLAKKRGRPPKAQAQAQLEENEETGGKHEPLTRTKGRPKNAVAPVSSSRKHGAKKTLPAKCKPTPAAESIVDLDATPKPSMTYGPPSSPSTLIQLDPTSSADITLAPLDRTILLQKITDAVTTYPPTHDMNNLTWYEKILMYDPIVLEDLALWLNTEGLGKVGVDEEVSSGMVKEWCEARSVCCLWRENLNGGVRARY